jgi:uncharacterized DUF497 family protein
MKLVGIEWDDDKNILNKQEHDLSFETAQFVFADPEKHERRSYNGYYQIDGLGWSKAT